MTNEEFIKSISLEGEIWKDVVGYEGKYLISSKGRVISLGRTIYAGGGGYKQSQPRLLKASIMRNGYYGVMLSDMDKRMGLNKTKPHYIHRMIAEAFIPNPHNKPMIDHINTDRTDNNISNLRWCTQKENMNNPITVKNNSHNESVVQLSLDNCFIRQYPSMESTKDVGFNPKCVSNCCRKTQLQHKGFHWMYLSDYETLINMSKNS